MSSSFSRIQPVLPSTARNLRVLSRTLVPLIALGSSAAALPGVVNNLLSNPGFEGGMAGWSVSGQPVVSAFYGDPSLPSAAVASRIGGDFQLVRDGGSSSIEQTVSIGSIPPGTNLHAGAYLGAFQEDEARLVVLFLNSGGSTIGRQNFEYVTSQTRNNEPVLMLSEKLLSIPAGTAGLTARIEFRNVGSSIAYACADEVFLELVSTSLTPPPLPLDTNLLNNPRFEEGWATGSPLSLTDVRGWYGAGATVVVKPYSNTDTSVPSEMVSCLVSGGEPLTSCDFGGAGHLLSDGGGGVLRQRLDVRGNQSQIQGGLALEVSALLGGMGGEPDTARIDVRFLRQDETSIGSVTALGPVTRQERNSETLVLLRERQLTVPALTGYIEVDVAFSNTGSSLARGTADNISVALTAPASAPPIALNSQLMRNGGFEDGPLPGSPLDPIDPHGWYGTTTSATEVLQYSVTNNNVPPPAFALANGLGSRLAGDLDGGAALAQILDLTGSQTAVDQGRLRLYAEAWLGGVGVEQDTAQIRINFLDLNGIPVSGEESLAPVTAAERGNQTTLILRHRDFEVPALTRRIEIKLIFTNTGSSLALALADGIRAVAYDVIEGGPLLYPGSRGDLRLLSGVGGYPTTGPGEDVKLAHGHDVLNLRVLSPGGTYDFARLMLVADLFPTGTPPQPAHMSFPGLELDPSNWIILADGIGCDGFGCPAVLPGGTSFTFSVPPMLAGYSVRLQGLVRSRSMSGPRPAFIGSEAHEIRIVP